MTKRIIGKPPEKRATQLGNADCIFHDQSAELIPLVGNYVHAVRCNDTVSRIERDTIYVMPEMVFSPNVTQVINFGASDLNEIVTDNWTEYKAEFVDHIMRKDIMLFDMSSMNVSGPSVPCIAINLLDNTMAYYVYEKNSWLCGNLGWHGHYISIVMSGIWPKLVQMLNLQKIENSINGPKPTARKIVCTVGCDPEFEMKKHTASGARIVKASNHLRGNDLCHSGVGLDGSAQQIEVRPRPGTPAFVTREIKKLIRSFADENEFYDLTDAGDKYPLGGHIHIGIGHEYSPGRELLMVLDDFIGRPTIELSGKARQEYKSLGAARAQPWGFEYRTTPSAVFQDPKIAYIVMTAMKNLCEKYFGAEELIYNDRPTVQDYVANAGLTLKQATYFDQFCHGGYKPVKSIRASWKVPEVKQITIQEYPLDVTFKGDWNSDTRAILQQEIAENLNSPVPGCVVQFFEMPVYVHSESCTLRHVDRFNSEDVGIPLWPSSNVLNVGVSSDMCHYGISSSRRASLLNAIQKEITAKFDGDQ